MIPTSMILMPNFCVCFYCFFTVICQGFPHHKWVGMCIVDDNSMNWI